MKCNTLGYQISSQQSTRLSSRCLRLQTVHSQLYACTMAFLHKFRAQYQDRTHSSQSIFNPLLRWFVTVNFTNSSLYPRTYNNIRGFKDPQQHCWCNTSIDSVWYFSLFWGIHGDKREETHVLYSCARRLVNIAHNPVNILCKPHKYTSKANKYDANSGILAIAVQVGHGYLHHRLLHTSGQPPKGTNSGR